MEQKKHGISADLLIHPGETISDILEERKITQKELAQRAVSEAFLSNVINGKKDISKGLAKGLEYALGVPASFWLNLQANYDAETLDIQETVSISEEEKEILKSINDVTTFLKKKSLLLNGTKEDTIIALRKLLRISSLTTLKTLAPADSLNKYNKKQFIPEVLAAWSCLNKTQNTNL